ncbi:ankyrin [Periconia macrospinosa]|uniref:Ankyrin n=1 Tax=Periconia macrospinosa TaxID=97972 RepID=A0A2V1D227_9PLEO|nr:ankyrin [Periconia macrospinosa]
MAQLDVGSQPFSNADKVAEQGAGGLKTVFGGEDTENIEYDIIVVPGLATDPIHCWASEKEDKKSWNWIMNSDGLHKEFPKARIMLYHYSSAWCGTYRVQTRFDDIASGLLNRVKDERASTSPNRPIVFIGHSMGGVVIAKAICLAHDSPADYPNFVPSVTGCIFFGTPFRGAEFAEFIIQYNTLRNLEYPDQDYTEVVKFLTPNNLELVDFTAKFTIIANSMTPKMNLCCIYEKEPREWGEWIDEFLKTMQRKMPERESEKGKTMLQKLLEKTTLQKLLEKTTLQKFQEKTTLQKLQENATFLKKKGPFCMVTDESATLPDFKRFGIDRKHDGLVRFNSSDDSVYKVVLAEIRPLIDAATHTWLDRRKERVLDPDKVHRLRNLFESEVNMRTMLHADKHPHEKNWLLKELDFDKWQNSEEVNCLWIEGPPGIGKTIASVAVANSITRTIEFKQIKSPREVKTLCVVFFCDERPCRSTAEDLLKSILLQMIDCLPKLAIHAEEFLDDQAISSRSKDGGHTYKQFKATMTVENLLQCLRDMLRDVSLYTVYIIVNNLHRLKVNDSLQKLLVEIERQIPKASFKTGGISVKWLLTAFSTARNDLSTRFNSSGLNSKVRRINLQNAENFKKVKSELRTHIQGEIDKLQKIKGYDDSLTFEVGEMIESKAENRQWVDVMCVELETLQSDCNRLQIRKLLEVAAEGSLEKLVVEAWEKVQDILRALVLLVSEVTVKELAVLTRYNSDEVAYLLQACTPMLKQGNQHVEFTNKEVKEYLLENWTSLLAGSETSLGDVRRQKEWQQAHLAWGCFMYMEKEYKSEILSFKKAEDYSIKESQETRQSHRKLLHSELSCAYAIRNWKKHVEGGGMPLAESLVSRLPQFWASDAPSRLRWLKGFIYLKDDFNDLESIESMTALHVTSALGLKDLSCILIRDESQIQALDGNHYTPLHLAAFNNRLEVTKLLLEHGAHVKESKDIASPLHLAAIRGHVQIIEQLLRSTNSGVSDVNAYSEKYGPVINAAIRSGTVQGIKMILDTPNLNLDFEPHIESPLQMAARISNDNVFHEILKLGEATWKTADYEEALVMASKQGRIKHVDIILSQKYHISDEHIERSLLLAGVGDHWTVVEKLLGQKRSINFNNIFFLAAATTVNQDKLLERIWNLASKDITQKIRNAAFYRATDHEKATTVSWLLQECMANPNATADPPEELAIECVNKFPGESYGDALTAAANDAKDGKIELLRTLLNHSATKIDSPHGAALQVAAREGHLEAVDLLLERGANIDRIVSVEVMKKIGMAEKSGSALQVACDYRQPATVKYLLERGADPNLANSGSDHKYPIISATFKQQPEILHHLLNDQRTNVNVRGGDESTPLHHACTYMDLDSVKKLLERGASINDKNGKGNQAIHMAASKGDMNIMKLLLEHKADIAHGSDDKGLALQEALRHQHQECSNLLADAIVPIFSSLKVAAEEGNGFAHSIISNPKGEHPHLNTAEIESLQQRIEALQQRNEDVEKTLEDYNEMAQRVVESRRLADEKVRYAEDAQAQLEKIQRDFEPSIEGFKSKKRELKTSIEKCKTMEKERDDAREERKTMEKERDAAIEESKTMKKERDAANLAQYAALQSRDDAKADREGALHARDEALKEGQNHQNSADEAKSNLKNYQQALQEKQAALSSEQETVRNLQAQITKLQTQIEENAHPHLHLHHPADEDTNASSSRERVSFNGSYSRNGKTSSSSPRQQQQRPQGPQKSITSPSTLALAHTRARARGDSASAASSTSESTNRSGSGKHEHSGKDALKKVGNLFKDMYYS